MSKNKTAKAAEALDVVTGESHGDLTVLHLKVANASDSLLDELMAVGKGNDNQPKTRLFGHFPGR
ncbi:MAG: hypothetical protein EPN61_14870 [Burkholderiaceae bacterium]|nr:MAG: hypothetical protein EPN61_14870 [Burkholderiaceae bacterium]